MFTFIETTQAEALIIANEWHYAKPYDFYDIQSDEEDYEEFTHSDTRKNTYSVFDDTHDLIGYITFNVSDSIEIGLGMKPNLTGIGLGESFLNSTLLFIHSLYPSINKFTLKVATFNERAIKVYKRCGFKEKQKIMMDTNGSIYEFLEMEVEL